MSNFDRMTLGLLVVALGGCAGANDANNAFTVGDASSGDEDDGEDEGSEASSDPQGSGEEEASSAQEGSSSPGGETTEAPDDDGEDEEEAEGPQIRLDVAMQGTLEGGITTETCADANVVITPGEATIMLLIDQSGTMSAGLGQTGTSRWQAVYDTLLEPASGVVGRYENDVQFGLTLYTNVNESGSQPDAECPDLQSVDPAFTNRAAMEGVYNEAEITNGDTPTGESLLAVAEQLAALDDGSSKAIVLATDGDPDTCANPNDKPNPSKGVAIQAAEASFNLGIPVFVIAVVDPGLDLEHLQDLANVGIGAASYEVDDDPYNDENTGPTGEDWVDTRTPDNPATLYTAETAEQLGAAFETLISNFVPCDFTLNGEVELAQQCLGTVTLDGATLECGVDWEVSTPSTLSLLPSACAILQNGQDHDVTADFPCEIFAEG